MNIICGVGNVIWLYIYYHVQYHKTDTVSKYIYNTIPLIVFVNGFMYHICLHNFYMKWYDIFVNSILVAFINYHTSEKIVTFIVSLFVIIVFYYNSLQSCKAHHSHDKLKTPSTDPCIDNDCIGDIIHVCLVNCPLLYLYMICEI